MATDPPGLRWVEKILPSIIELSIFGGSITFTVVVAQNRRPQRFEDSLQTFLALGWFFFVLTLGVATAAQMALSFQRNNIRDAFNQGYRTWRAGNGGARTLNERMACAIFVFFKIADILCVLVLLAFMFLSLCVVAYDVVVGWLAFACTVAMIGFTILIWIIQNFFS
jgi:hypothetical protein